MNSITERKGGEGDQYTWMKVRKKQGGKEGEKGVEVRRKKSCTQEKISQRDYYMQSTKHFLTIFC